MGDRKIRKKDCVRLSNKIIERCQLSIPPISNIEDIHSNLFVSLLQVLCGQLPAGIIPEPASTEEEVANVQTIINHLALDLINVDLSHISGADVIAGKPRSIFNLLEIFCGLHKYLSSTDIDKWNLEESLTETEEELSSGTSSSDQTPADGGEPSSPTDTAGGTAEAVPSTGEDAATVPEADAPVKTPSASASASASARSSASGGVRAAGSGSGTRRSVSSTAGTPPRSASRSGSGTAGTPPRSASRSGSSTAGTPPRSASRSGSGALPPSGSRGSTTGSPARRRSGAELPAGAASSGSSAVTTTTTGSTASARTSASGGTAVSFPESEFSVHLPMSPDVSGTITSTKQPGQAPDASWEETAPADQEAAPRDQEAGPEDQEAAPEDQETAPEDQEAAGVDEQPAEGGTSTESAAPESPTSEETEEEAAEEPAQGQGEERQSVFHGKFEPRHFDFLEETETEEGSDVDVTDNEDADISRQLSKEMQDIQEQTAGSSNEKTSTGTEKPSKESSTPSEPTTSVPEQTTTTETAPPPPPPAPAPARPRADSRPGRSAPCQAAARGRRRRSSDRSSASDPAVNRRPPCRRLLTRNIETIAEIHESGGERAVTQTTREQAGDTLCKHVVQREVRRKVHSAPEPTRRMSYSKQSSRRSVCSDGVLQWLESQGDDTYLKVQGQETDVFEFLRREMPYVHVSEETKRRLLFEYRRQMKYIMSLVEPSETRQYKIRRQDVLRRQSLLTDIIRQQKAHDKRFRRITEAKRAEIKRRNVPRDHKISCLRAQRYVDSFKQQFQSRMALNKSKEELLLKAVFEEMLDIQRRRLRTVRGLEKQAIKEFYGADGYTSDLNRMHQFYEANFRDLAQLLSREKAELQMSEKEQAKLADRIRREFRAYMESDVSSLNDKIVNSWQPQYRELDADRIRSDLYQANWKFCVT